MVLTEKRITLKNGIDCLVRSPGPEDAEAVIRHLRRTSSETPFMARYPEEITISPWEERSFLKKQRADPKRVMAAAFVNGRLCANAGIVPAAPYVKYQHRAELGISIQRRFWGIGLGGVLLCELCAIAPSMGYEQIELEVACENRRAVRLYERFGFTIYGERPASFRYRDGTYAGEYLMRKQL